MSVPGDLPGNRAGRLVHSFLVTESRTRFLAAGATTAGLIAGGFEAHLAGQTLGTWHGLTGSCSLTRAGLGLLAGWLVFRLGRRVRVSPFLAMGLGLLPFVPALTGFGSALLFFSGYSMVLGFAILLGLVGSRLIPRMRPPTTLTVVFAAFAVFVLVGRYLPGPAGPQGDEPHYLLIAESLLHDGDVDLKNQFDEKAFLKFTGPGLEPHTAPRSPKDHLYAIHTPGLSALIAPGYALGGYSGARIVVSGVMALAVGLVYFVSRSMFGAGPALFVFAASTFASPLAIYANSLFPDSVATLPVALTLAYLVAAGPRMFASSTLAIALLPWLHPRLLPLGLLLALALSIRPSWSGKRALLAFGPLLASVGLLLWHFQRLFGTASLSAAYGPGFADDVSVARIPWGASALLFDRQFGLLLFSPLLLLCARGVTLMTREQRPVALLCGAIAAIQLGVGGAFTMWWGGASAPVRFLVAAVPALLIAAGACWREAEARPERRGWLGAGAGFGAGVLLLGCLAPRALHNRADGGSGLLRLLAPSLDLDRFFPGFVSGEGVWLAWWWGFALFMVFFRPRLALLAGILPLFAATGVASTPLLEPFSSSLRLLESWTDHRRAFGGEDSPSAFSLSPPLGEPDWGLTPGARKYSPRFSLPKGVWTLRVEARPENDPGALNLARVSLLGSDEDAPPLVTAMIRAGEPVVAVDFELGTSQQRVNLLGEGIQSRAVVVSVRLTPRTLAR